MELDSIAITCLFRFFLKNLYSHFFSNQSALYRLSQTRHPRYDVRQGQTLFKAQQAVEQLQKLALARAVPVGSKSVKFWDLQGIPYLGTLEGPGTPGTSTGGHMGYRGTFGPLKKNFYLQPGKS